MYTKKEIIGILKDNTCDKELFKQADLKRLNFVGNEIHLRGLIEFSNICKRKCKYCGLRCENKEIDRYRILKDEILIYTQKAIELGYKTIVLQSGEDDYFTTERICEIITEIKKFDVSLTLSIGERSYNDYKLFKECGANRYLLRIETTDQNLYKKMHPNMSYANRLNCLLNLKELGYETGTGCLVGLPDQSIDSLANDIIFFKKIDADMIGIGPFISHPNTPLKHASNGSFNLALKVMALTRLMLPDINIPATTAMETLNPNGRLIALQCGANVVMPNVTEQRYHKKYEIYPNKMLANEDSLQLRSRIEDKIKSIGRTISTGYGNRQKT